VNSVELYLGAAVGVGTSPPRRDDGSRLPCGARRRPVRRADITDIDAVKFDRAGHRATRHCSGRVDDEHMTVGENCAVQVFVNADDIAGRDRRDRAIRLPGEPGWCLVYIESSRVDELRPPLPNQVEVIEPFAMYKRSARSVHLYCVSPAQLTPVRLISSVAANVDAAAVQPTGPRGVPSHTRPVTPPCVGRKLVGVRTASLDGAPPQLVDHPIHPASGVGNISDPLWGRFRDRR
jgi:hypothetical protein